MSVEVGALVFFCCPEKSWTVGTVTEWDAKKKMGSCKAKEGGAVVSKLKEESIFVAREDILDEDVNDLLHLTLLHDSTLLNVLRMRYMRDTIYTNIGAIVVALNPFNFKIPHYVDAKMPDYLAEGDRIERNLPHSWAVAHNTYYEMMNDQYNQCILVSGESGAGKTEASKIVMKYLAAVSCKSGNDTQKSAAMQVGTKINACSPPLESYGNAKTVRNDNSSRFGKFMKVRFSPDGILTGAHITKYLLEKSRIVTASPGERVYHSFYLVLKGKDAAAFGLGDPKEYRSVSAGKTWDNKEFNSAEEYQEAFDAMQTIGCTLDEASAMWRVTAAILHLLNADFDPDGEGSVISPSTTKYVDQWTKMLQVEPAQFREELVRTKMEIGGQLVTKMLAPVKAVDGRDALVKALYDSEFGWLVEKCNSILDIDASGFWVGLLDIFGFEDFEINSFEQFCINLANETLQGHYNQFIFTKDMEECRAEGIDVTEVEFPDNSPCLIMMMGKGGICALLDEECALGKGSDLGFLGKVCEKHSKNPFFQKKTLAKSSFIVHHYAGSVSYEIEGFLEKNRDTLKDSFKNMMRASQDPFVAALLPEPVQKAGAKLTVGGFFKNQLRDLMDLINSTNPHWIRCVKPHPAKKPLMLSGVSTMNQLASAGVLGTVKIRKAGFPVRIKFSDFAQRYRIIGVGHGAWPSDLREQCELIIKATGVDPKKAQVGKSRIFLKSEAYVDVENCKKRCLQLHAAAVQAWALGLTALDVMKQRVYEKNKQIIDKLREQAKKVFDLRKAERIARPPIETAQLAEWEQMVKEFDERSYVIDRERIEAVRQAHLQRLADDRQGCEDEWRKGRERIMQDEARARADFMAMIELSEQKARRAEQRRALNEARDASRRAQEEKQREREQKQAKLEAAKAEKARQLAEAAEQRERRAAEAEARRLQVEQQRRQKLLQAAWREHKHEEITQDLRESGMRLGGGKVLSPEERARRDQREWQRHERQKRRSVQGEYVREVWERNKLEDQEMQRRELQRQQQERQLHREQVQRKRLEERRLQEERRRRMAEEELAISREVQRIRERQTEVSLSARAERERARRRAEEKEFKMLMTYFESQREREQAERERKSKEFDELRKQRMSLQSPEADHDMKGGWVPLSKRLGPPSEFVMSGGRPTSQRPLPASPRR